MNADSTELPCPYVPHDKKNEGSAISLVLKDSAKSFPRKIFFAILISMKFLGALVLEVVEEIPFTAREVLAVEVGLAIHFLKGGLLNAKPQFLH